MSTGSDKEATARFGALSTTDEVLEGVDLTGKTVLVTGVSAGLGVETARALVAHGARVIGTARDLGNALEATSGVCPPASSGSFEVVECDLASLASVRRCAEDVAGRTQRLDAIIANAGVMVCPESRTADGFETQFGTNHLGHFVLVNRLVPLLAPGSRIVSLSSSGHRYAPVSLDDPGFERDPYDPVVAYGRSKTANALFAVEFDRRHKGEGIRAVAVHPGSIRTELMRHLTREIVGKMTGGKAEGRAQAHALTEYKTVPQGAATSLWAGFVADANAVGGRYCEDCAVAKIVPNESASGSGVREYAIDPEQAKRLWTMSEAMVGEQF